MIWHRKLISMLLKRDEVADLQTGKNMSSLLFLNEHEEGRAGPRWWSWYIQDIGLYGESQVSTLSRIGSVLSLTRSEILIRPCPRSGNAGWCEVWGVSIINVKRCLQSSHYIKLLLLLTVSQSDTSQLRIKHQLWKSIFMKEGLGYGLPHYIPGFPSNVFK